MKRNLKKLVSMFLALTLILSVAVIAPISVGASETNSESVGAVDTKDRYIPSDSVTDTHRYYFYMPSEWYTNNEINTAGIYWYSGDDACNKWPGYKAQSSEDVLGLYYVDCPANVPKIIWNNFFDGGTDKTTDKYVQAVQTVDINVENMYKEFASDGDVINPALFEKAYEKINAEGYDKLGGFYENFFESDYGFAFNFNNMIYIINPEYTIENALTGKLTYGGDWYFYYGDGTYGTKLTKEESEVAGTLKSLPYIHYDNTLSYLYELSNDGTVEIIRYYGTESEVTIPSEIDGYVVKKVGEGAFSYNGTIKSVTIPDSVTNIGTEAFSGCKGLTSIIIPDSVTEIDEYAFNSCSSLTEINVDSNNMNYASVDGVLYNKDQSKLIVYPQGKTESSFSVPDSVTVIGDRAFSGCASLTSITIPVSVTSIDSYAFDGCENIADVHYCGSWDSWKEIEIEYGNNALTHKSEIYFTPEWWSNISWNIDNEGTLTISGIGVINPDGYSIEEDIPWCSEHESIKNVVIEEGITGIGNYAFMKCSNLETVSIPASVTDIGDFVFTYDMNSVKSINVDENNENYKSADGVLFNKDMTEIIKYPNGRSGSYTIPETVTTIHTCAFRECTELTELEIPDSVSTFESYAFYDCDSLLSVTIPSSVKEMDSSFVGCGLGYKFHKGFDEPIEGFTIKGYKGTAAESYANKNNFTFIDLDNVISGDANGDGEINAKDRMMLTRHLAKWTGYESVDMTAADVNNDGDVNAKDRMILTRHLAKWQGYETLPFDKI